MYDKTEIKILELALVDDNRVPSKFKEKAKLFGSQLVF